MRALPLRLQALQLMNIVICGKTTIFNADELGELGLALCSTPTPPCKVQSQACRCLTLLKNEHKVDEDPIIVAPFLERQRLVNKDFWDGLEQKYK